MDRGLAGRHGDCMRAAFRVLASIIHEPQAFGDIYYSAVTFLCGVGGGWLGGKGLWWWGCCWWWWWCGGGLSSSSITAVTLKTRPPILARLLPLLTLVGPRYRSGYSSPALAGACPTTYIAIRLPQ